MNLSSTNLQHLRQHLEQASATYDTAAFLQREIADRMLSRLDYIKLEPNRILDVGCRTGHTTQQLASRFKNTTIIAIEIANNMLRKSRRQQLGWKQHLPLFSNSPIKYICASVEQLPLAASCSDLMWSNLTLHHYDLHRSITEAYRLLNTGGLFMFSTFGPDTLKELRHIFAGMDEYTHVNSFIDMHDLGDAIVHAGFADPVMDMEVITITFDDLKTIVQDLKSLGERNYLANRRPNLMPPKCWQEVTARYESFRQNGKLPVTVEVIYGHAWKPQQKSLPDGRQIIQFRDYPKN